MTSTKIESWNPWTCLPPFPNSFIYNSHLFITCFVLLMFINILCYPAGYSHFTLLQWNFGQDRQFSGFRAVQAVPGACAHPALFIWLLFIFQSKNLCKSREKHEMLKIKQGRQLAVLCLSEAWERESEKERDTVSSGRREMMFYLWLMYSPINSTLIRNLFLFSVIYRTNFLTPQHVHNYFFLFLHLANSLFFFFIVVLLQRFLCSWRLNDCPSSDGY